MFGGNGEEARVLLGSTGGGGEGAVAREDEVGEPRAECVGGGGGAAAAAALEGAAPTEGGGGPGGVEIGEPEARRRGAGAAHGRP